LNAKRNPTCPNEGLGCKFNFSNKAKILETKGKSSLCQSKFKIASCCYMHGQAIQSILTTPMHPYSKQISENKKIYKSRYPKEKKNMEVGSLAPKQLSTIRLLPQGSPSFSPNIKNFLNFQEF
jgi:hypothetical protein